MGRIRICVCRIRASASSVLALGLGLSAPRRRLPPAGRGDIRRARAQAWNGTQAHHRPDASGDGEMRGNRDASACASRACFEFMITYSGASPNWAPGTSTWVLQAPGPWCRDCVLRRLHGILRRRTQEPIKLQQSGRACSE